MFYFTSNCNIQIQHPVTEHSRYILYLRWYHNYQFPDHHLTEYLPFTYFGEAMDRDTRESQANHYQKIPSENQEMYTSPVGNKQIFMKE